MQIVCVPCNRFMRAEKNGMRVVELYSDTGAPYQIWAADKYKCPSCGTEAVSAFGAGPLMQQHEPSFQTVLARAISADTAIEASY